MKASIGQIEVLSPELHAIVAGLHENDGPLCQSIYDEIRETVSDYRLAAEVGLPDDLKASLTWHIRLWHEALLQARMPSEDVLEQAGALTVVACTKAFHWIHCCGHFGSGQAVCGVP